DGSSEDAGVSLTLDEALEAMITISDNGAALALWHILGGSNIDATLTKAGMPDFHVAFDDSEDNVATPHAIGTFFTLLAKRQLISPAASDRMLARLERQQINNRLPAQLPPGVVVAHKTGNLAGLTHDAGIIYTKSGPRVVVAMTWHASVDVLVPQQPGTYTVTLGLTDAGGNALASQGAATATFSLRAHRPYLVTAQVHMPIVLHRDEPSLLVTAYSALQTSGDHSLAISWRVVDTRTSHTVVQGSSPLGTLRPGASGTFISSFLAPSVLGTYRLVYEPTEPGRAVSA